ncbi:no circadian temperature entrainment isoform X3 [Rhynchophorus ferrugineus]|uniref:no circadian temperature entrainment isoform X3 n=1 Tax=Rhynchophorus ferrugineus TaxID=354439 RepID=UPI003FCCE1C0
MSTLSGTASKGEKTKPKFQSLDINSLYKISRGENTEKPTQKCPSSHIKHGMQSLGKVPSARRAPANLPSIKSEHSESGAAVPLVPPGATGWGKQEQSNAQSQSIQNGTSQSHGAPPAAQGPQLTPHQQTAALPSTNAVPPHSKQTSVTAQPAGSSAGDKLWSTVMASGPPDGVHPPAYQSPQFQHEFPSLSAGDGAGGSGSRASEYGATGLGGGQAGLSLRPQTEGSWTQGGQRVSDNSRGGSVQPGVAPQLSAQVGRQAEHLPPQVRSVLPPFMYKGSFSQGNSTTAPVNQPQTQAPSAALSSGGRRAPENRPPRFQDRDITPEELTPRPIIREEELSKLDEIGFDIGWAGSDEIDYNQKLAFSDDESDRPPKKDYKPSAQQYHQTQSQPKSQDVRVERQTPPRLSSQPSRPDFRGRQSEEDDIMAQKQRQHQKELDLAILRAKQRKEEEEKRFNEESRQRALKKLQELDEKVREKRDRDRDSEIGTINPSIVPPKPINPVEIPLPDFHKDKDSHSRVSTDPQSKEENSTFRQMTQIEGKSFNRKQQQKPERDHREQNGPSFSRQFQNDLPPRFMKHQQRNNSSAQPASNYQHYETSKWSSSMPRAPSRGGKSESPERRDDDRRDKDYKRQSSEDSYRSSHHSQQEIQRSQEMHYHEDIHHKNVRDEDKWSKDKLYERRGSIERENSEKLEKQERPQRPDSRDSYTSHASHTSHGSQGSNRRSRDSEMKESMNSWNEDVEGAYEESLEKKHSMKDEKRSVPSLVPGPITRDRIEAEDINDKRNLTQLKKGESIKKPETFKKEEKSPVNEKLMWADSIPQVEEVDIKKEQESKHMGDVKKDDYKDRQSRNNRNFASNKNWGSTNSSDFHSKGSTWGNKQRPLSRGRKGRDFYGHGTDSDGSTDTPSIDSKDSKGVQKKITDKDDKNRENKEKYNVDQKKQQDRQDKKEGGYIPRGEPSRHGRGGGNNFRSNRISGLGKRIDGYGPPPSKSPFGHHEERKIGGEDSIDSVSGSATDKIKQNQEALAAGIIGKTRPDGTDDKNKNKPKNESRRNKSKSRKEEPEKDSNSEHSDGKDGAKKPLSRSSSQKGGPGSGDRRAGNDRRDRNNQSRNSDKKSAYDNKRSENKPDAQNILTSALADLSVKSPEDEIDDKNLNGDSEGFQEVKSKKNGKERQKGPEDKKTVIVKNDNKDSKSDRKSGNNSKSSIQQITPAQLQNIPPLMGTPVNPPQILPQSKNQYEQRSRQTKLPPRFAKQKMQKQMQQQIINDVSDINKGNPASHVYGMKDNTQVPPPVTGCAWDKPLGPQLRSNENDVNNMLTVSIDVVKLEVAGSTPGHGTSPGNDKMLPKQQQTTDKNLLDGSTPPVNTIIFENTNYKSAPGARSTSRGSVASVGSDKGRSKLEEDMDNVFRKPPITEFLQKTDSTGKADPIQLGVFKEETDMKLDFFGTDLTHLTDDKGSKALCSSKSMTPVNSTICNADSLNMKIASVKKVWETSEQESEDSNGINFGGPVMDNVFKSNDTQDDTHESYSPGNNQSASTTNICKVKPTQQVSSGTGQTASSATQQHSAIVGHTMLLNPTLSPPPMAPAPVGVSLGPQPYAANQHLAGFQPTGQGVAAAGSAQFSISAIPSPPTVLYNSTPQQLQSASLYGTFLPPADQASVLGGQGHARAGGFGQYPAAAGAYHGLGQAANSPYNPQSVFLPTAAHPPPTPQAPPEMYQSINSFRLSAAAPFGQSQPLNNPTTVLISSTSNSLMSASVKPSSQPISAIGTKAGGVGQAYQQQSQQGQQVYMAYEPAIPGANYLPGAGVMQRGHGGPPVQNSVVPGMQPSSSYYSGGQTGYFQQPGNSTLPSAAQLPQHQAGYGLQGNVFGTHNQSHTNTGMQSYQSFLSSHMHIAAAMNAQQQYRSAALPNPYIKGGAQPVAGDQSQGVPGQRPQQLKSPSSQEVLSSVFNSGLYCPQIPSPKSRQNNKHTPQQSSPTSQRKYFYQGVGNQQINIQQRYPAPIQRPVNFQQQSNMNSVQNNGPNQKHNRNNTNKPTNKQYYGSQNNSVSSNQNDKSDDSKVSDCPPPKSVNTSSSDLPKDNLKEETPAMKD